MPVGLSRKKTTPKKGSVLQSAKEAVITFEQERDTLHAMRDEFSEKFPEAGEFLQTIQRQEDLVQDTINSAVPLIREAKRDVGDFKCQLKKSKPRYDDKEFLELVAEVEEGGAILIELIEGGYVKKVALDPSAAAYFAQRPSHAEHFQSAWRDAEEMTPAVTPPKY